MNTLSSPCLALMVAALMLNIALTGCAESNFLSSVNSPLPTPKPMRPIRVITATPPAFSEGSSQPERRNSMLPLPLTPRIFQGLPDIGGRLAFATDNSGIYQIAVMDLSTGQITQLTNSPDPGDAEPSWSPDGRELIFTSSRNKSYRFELFAMQADGSSPRLIIASNDFDNFSPSYSPDGQKIVFHTNRDGNMEVYTANVDGSNQRNLTRHPANDGTASWSPDGTKIVFSSDRNGLPQIFIMDADGSNVRLLFNHPDHLDFRPRYSPDGQKIVFGTQNRYSLDYHLALIDADGQNYQQLTEGVGEFSQAAWIDNRTLVFSGRRSRNDHWQLYILQILESGGITIIPITSDASNYRNPVWTK